MLAIWFLTIFLTSGKWFISGLDPNVKLMIFS